MARKQPKPGNGSDTAAASAGTDTTGAAPAVLEQQIREVAYGYFVERGCTEGHDLDDWLRAEAQVRASAGNAAPGRPANAT